jgi:hypothetical protein
MSEDELEELVAKLDELLGAHLSDEDANEVLTRLMIERKRSQTWYLGVSIESLTADAEKRASQWMRLGIAVEGVRNFLAGRAGQGKFDDPVLRKRREMVGPLVDRFYEIAEQDVKK